MPKDALKATLLTVRKDLLKKLKHVEILLGAPVTRKKRTPKAEVKEAPKQKRKYTKRAKPTDEVPDDEA